MEAKLVCVTLALQCGEDQVTDAVNELLRDLQSSVAPASCLLDYSVDDSYVGVECAEPYEEGAAFAALSVDTASAVLENQELTKYIALLKYMAALKAEVAELHELTGWQPSDKGEG